MYRKMSLKLIDNGPRPKTPKTKLTARMGDGDDFRHPSTRNID